MTARNPFIWIVGLLILAGIILFLVFLFSTLILLIPFIFFLILGGYFFRMLNKLKKQPSPDKGYIDVSYKIKK